MTSNYLPEISAEGTGGLVASIPREPGGREHPGTDGYVVLLAGSLMIEGWQFY